MITYTCSQYFSASIKTKEFESIDYGISLTDEYSCWCGSKPPPVQRIVCCVSFFLILLFCDHNDKHFRVFKSCSRYFYKHFVRPFTVTKAVKSESWKKLTSSFSFFVFFLSNASNWNQLVDPHMVLRIPNLQFFWLPWRKNSF